MNADETESNRTGRAGAAARQAIAFSLSEQKFYQRLSAMLSGFKFLFPTLAFLAAAAAPASTNDPALIPASVYRPLFRSDNEPGLVPVRAFHLDVFPVSNAQFLEFVRAHPEWRRSRVSRSRADESYLRHWAGDLALGTNAPPDVPVTFVSSFAARAFAEARGQRLPTAAEWELAAAASPARPDGANDTNFMRAILNWYMTPAPETLGLIGRGRPNFFGVHDLHGLVWEWVADANSSTNADSRSQSSGPRDAFCGGGAQGARDLLNYPAFMRTSFRSSLQPAYCIHNLGFRCAQGVAGSVPRQQTSGSE